MNRRRVLAAALFAGVSVSAEADDLQLPRADDLQALATEMSKRRIPLLILFSTPGCPYCLEVRRNYLQPRLTEASGQVLIREVGIGGSRPIRLPSGQAITEAQFTARFDVRIAPVVILLDQQMELLVDPLVGLDRSGFYEATLQAAIDAARVRLRARP